jgi:hypothetical protein
MPNKEAIQNALYQNLELHTKVLKDAYSASLVSLEAFQDWAFDTFKSLGVQAEDFKVDFE